MTVEVGIGEPGEVDDAVDGQIVVAALGGDARDRRDQPSSLLVCFFTA